MNWITPKQLHKKIQRSKTTPKWKEKKADQIKALLAKRPMTRAEICKELNIKKGTFDGVLAGHRQNINTVQVGLGKYYYELRGDK